MKSFNCLLSILFISFLVVGCRSSRSGSSHSELEITDLQESRHDSTDFKSKFARYLSEQKSNFKVQVVEYFPPEPGDSSIHGAVKSITNIDLSSTSKSDSTISEKQITATSDTTSRNSYMKEKENSTYKIKQTPWYEPFIPYLVLGFLGTVIYYLRRKK
jgi:hypothetical protein|nr:MAG TPA: hypothetical protein [Caudoviricetes sp.]